VESRETVTQLLNDAHGDFERALRTGDVMRCAHTAQGGSSVQKVAVAGPACTGGGGCAAAGPERVERGLGKGWAQTKHKNQAPPCPLLWRPRRARLLLRYFTCLVSVNVLHATSVMVALHALVDTARDISSGSGEAGSGTAGQAACVLCVLSPSRVTDKADLAVILPMQTVGSMHAL
jgi:hypothetical protein